MSNGDKAREMLQQATKKEESATGFFAGLLGGAEPKRRDAAELRARAANLFKMDKSWQEAGAAFEGAARAHDANGDPHEAAQMRLSAASAYKKCSSADAIRCLEAGVNHYTSEGRFSSAAKHQKEIAELQEGESKLEEAIASYQRAADFYEGEGAVSSANQCLLKVAQFSAQLENYEKAYEVYEHVATEAMQNNLLKYGVKEHLLKAGLCRLCTGDLVSARRALERYQDIDYSFSSQRECKFLQTLVDAYEEYDVEAFTSAVVDYDSITTLDSWKTKMLLTIKNAIKEQDESLT